ncbi:MAG TPA: hypothetical protein PLD88_10700, partial [Candidatus Berkiella sp.]|nr:hypothetical protein [Candidatus Berkiella sp.]
SDLYIDANTGLELDYPLEQKIAMETDGIHHFHSGRHNMVHNMKANALLESGWTRVGIQPSGCTPHSTSGSEDFCLREVHGMAQILNLGFVNAYAEKYQTLMSYSQQIKDKIKIMHAQLLIEINQITYQKINQEINELLEIDSQIRAFTRERFLGKLLKRNPDCSITRLHELSKKHVEYRLWINEIKDDILRSNEEFALLDGLLSTYEKIMTDLQDPKLADGVLRHELVKRKNEIEANLQEIINYDKFNTLGIDIKSVEEMLNKKRIEVDRKKEQYEQVTQRMSSIEVDLEKYLPVHALSRFVDSLGIKLSPARKQPAAASSLIFSSIARAEGSSATCQDDNAASSSATCHSEAKRLGRDSDQVHSAKRIRGRG